MKEVYLCEICEKPFYSKEECFNHEIKCNPRIKHHCASCGKKESHLLDKESWDAINQWHKIKIDHVGYGSQLEDKAFEFEFCDDCLVLFVQKAENVNNDSNYYFYGEK